MNQFNHVLTNRELTVTESAKAKIKNLVKDTNGEASAVRIYVTGGGCSGMNYEMSFAKESKLKDSVMNDWNGFKILIDPIALNFLTGAEVDYVDDGTNASFIFNHVFQSVGGDGGCSGCKGSTS